MLSNIPEMSQHLILAIDHHRQLLDDAHRQRLVALTKASRGTSHGERWVWLRRVRVGIGAWLIYLGQRLATEASTSASSSTPSFTPRKKTAWG